MRKDGGWGGFDWSRTFFETKGRTRTQNDACPLRVHVDGSFLQDGGSTRKTRQDKTQSRTGASSPISKHPALPKCRNDQSANPVSVCSTENIYATASAWYTLGLRPSEYAQDHDATTCVPDSPGGSILDDLPVTVDCGPEGTYAGTWDADVFFSEQGDDSNLHTFAAAPSGSDGAYLGWERGILVTNDATRITYATALPDDVVLVGRIQAMVSDLVCLADESSLPANLIRPI